MGDNKLVTTSDLNYVLEKLVEGFEHNLDIQEKYFEKNAAFLEELHQIKNRLDLTDRSNLEIRADIDKVMENTFEFLRRIDKVSNQEIMEMLIQFKSDKADLFTIVNDMHTQLDSIKNTIYECQGQDATLRTNIHDMGIKIDTVITTTAESNKLYKTISGILIVITILISGATIASKMIDSSNMKEIKTYIDTQKGKK